MNSMTGFGRSEAERQGLIVAVQVSSVNRKNLEVFCVLPKELQSLERSVTEQVRQKADRGRFQFSFDIRSEANSSSGLPPDGEIEMALSQLERIMERRGLPFKVDPALVVAVSSLIESPVAGLDEDSVAPLLGEAVAQALAALLAMRAREGEALQTDLGQRRERLVSLVGEVEALAPQMVQRHRENLLARLEQAGLEVDLDDERVLKEIALFADRCDVSEELTRLSSHLDQFAELLAKQGPVGRSLEFLVQEMGREVNTIGSKACSIEISRSVMELKNELERIREQMANVE